MANFTASSVAVNSDWLFPAIRGGGFTVEDSDSDHFTIKYDDDGLPGAGLRVTFFSNADNFTYNGGGLPTGGTFGSMSLATGGNLQIVLASLTGLGSLQLSSFADSGAFNGNDVLAGNFGNDILHGYDGKNIYIGKGGNDTFIVGLDDDSNSEIHGSGQEGSGGKGETDTIEFRATNSLATELITDIDAVTFAAGTNAVAAFLGADLGGLSSKLHVTGDASPNTLAFHSAVTGGTFNLSHLTFSNWDSDNVLLDGSAVSDILIGSKRGDTIVGQDGIDLLRGGRGRDLLDGGDGADRFDYNSLLDSRKGAAKHDHIEDFDHLDGDRIDLKTIDANTQVNSNQKFHFIGNHAFHHQEGELRFTNGLVRGDVDGDGRADFEIAVDNVADLVRADFIL